MRSIYLQPNSPRGRIEYVVKSMPNVAYDTAFVVAHTVGADRDAIALARRSGAQLPVEVFSADKPHPNEAMIGWVAQQLAAGQRAVRKQQATPEQYSGLVFTLEAKLPQIAVWAENTKPNLSAVSVAQAVAEASAFKLPESKAPVPQGEVIYRFADGWTVQNLTTPEQIYAEGLAVQNCLREEQNGPNYARGVKKGTTQILSLRSPQGRPAVSIEYLPKEKRFEQVYAKQNTPLGATLESLKEDGIQDAESLWEAIQKYKPRMRELILQKFEGNLSGLVLIDVPLPDGVKKIDQVDFGDYTCRLPDSIEEIGEISSLEVYQYPLPASLKKAGGVLALVKDYRYPLPESLKSVGRLSLFGYQFPVGGFSVDSLAVFSDYDYPIDGIRQVKESLSFGLGGDGRRRGVRGSKDQANQAKYQWPIPRHFKLENLRAILLQGYNHPLPDNLKQIKGSLTLKGYDCMLPAALESVGSLSLAGYNHPLPPSLSRVTSLDLVGYSLEFPEHLQSVGLVSVVGAELEDCPYPFPVPSQFPTDLDHARKDHTQYPRKQSKKRAADGSRKPVPYPHTASGIGGVEEIAANLPIPEGIEVLGFSDEEFSDVKSKAENPWDMKGAVPSFALVGYSHPLPSTLRKINGDLSVYGYDYPLPSSLGMINGELTINCYDHPLPRGLVVDSLNVGQYNLTLSTTLIQGSSSVRLTSGAPKLPHGMRAIKGDLVLFRYPHLLPGDIETIGGSLWVQSYAGRLPSSLKKVDGKLRLGEMSAPLPESLEVVGDISLEEYTHPLPWSLKRVKKISLSGYEQPLPPGLLPEDGYVDTEGYPHPIPGQTPKLQPNRMALRSRTSRHPVRRTSRGRKTSRR